MQGGSLLLQSPQLTPYTDHIETKRPMTLETDLLNAWDETMAELTPEQREILAKGTAKDWAEAIADCATDPTFWGQIGAAFVEGMIKGATR